MSDEMSLIAGRYRLDELIGRGGMGDVYRGTDVQTGTTVAIKLLHESILADNPDIVDRFTREGEALRQLDHPNIVKVLDTLEEDGRHYLILEYVSGGSLRDLMDEQGRLPLPAVLNVALDLADALTRAHRLNIIHRDIKPDNVLLAEDGTPRLTDFGVAHLGNRTRLTQTGSVIGTYAYLSPEACNGLELDSRTDIWSFGVMLYEILTGRLPFQEASTGAILTAILTKPAPDLDRLRPGLPRPLVDLITRMLEKDRERRINSVRLIGAELEALIHGLDTPLRSLLLNVHESRESRFRTPSDQGVGDVPAMVRGIPEQTHGLSLYPGSPETIPPPPTSGLPPMMTPGGTPITGEYPAVTGAKWKWIALMVIVTVLACSVVAVIAILLGPETRSSNNNSNNITTGQTETPPTPSPTPAPVEPVAEGEVMVLVAQFEPLGGLALRDISRFIVDDLTRQIEVGVPYSKVRVRTIREIIRSDTEAQEVAAANGATVILWGAYALDGIDAQIQIGTTSAFPHIGLDRDALARTANVRVHLTDERTESVAANVLGVLATLQGADGNIYEFMRTLAVMAEITGTPATIVGDDVAAYVHRYFANYAADTAESLRDIDGAIDKDAANPFLYALRSLALQHEGQSADSRRAAETAARLGPDRWTVPLILLAINADTLDQSIGYYDAIITERPDDWFALSSRGALYYLLGDYDHARSDLDASIALQPDANYPYAMAGLTAIAQGRFADAFANIQVILDDFPDPDLYSRIVGATVGGHDTFGPLISTFINVSLGRYEQAISTANTGIERVGTVSALIVMRGVSYCNLHDYVAAEASYAEALDNTSPPMASSGSPYDGFIHLLRGEARLKQNDVSGARDDFAVAATTTLSPDMVEAFKTGQIGCENLFGTAALMAIAGPSGTTTPVPTASQTAGATLVPGAADVVEPVAPGEVMVLVAELENLAGIGQIAATSQRDVTRLVVNDLQETLETAVPFSNVRVRRFPDVIKSDSEARAAAESVGATVIVWGNYTADLTELEIETGVLTAFPHNTFPRAVIDRTTDVRVHLTDARRESVAPYVLNVLTLLELADGNGYEALRIGAILDAIETTPAELVGNSVAAQTHRALLAKGQAASGAVSSALELDAGNALLYALQSILDHRQGQADAAVRDAQTAERVGPEGWTMPKLLMANYLHDESVMQLFDEIIAARPDDWFPLFFRAAIYYSLGSTLPDGYTRARADLDAAIALHPNANFPYIYAALLALHESRLDDAAALIQTILKEFPDPGFMERLMGSTFGDSGPNPYTVTMSAFVNLVLGRHESALANAETGIQTLGSTMDTTDLYLIAGLSYCALDQFDAARTSLDNVLVHAPDFGLARLMRADILLSQDQPDAADQDFALIADSPQADALAPYVAAVQSRQMTCATLFDPDSPLFNPAGPGAAATRTTPEATPTVSGDTAFWAVEPVARGEIMALVAELEPLGGVTSRDVARFVADDLTRTLEDELPNSRVRVRRYPDVITSADEARAIAEASGAAVVVWGNYTAVVIELEVQVGALKDLPYNPFTRDVLEQTGNIRVRLTDERMQSVAVPVLDVINLLTMADGDQFHFILTLTMLDAVDVTGGEIVGNSPAAYLHRALAAYGPKPSQAESDLNQAIALDSSNPLLYAYRGVVRMRIAAFAAAAADLRTAGRLGPDTWAMPTYFADSGTPDIAIEAYNAVSALRPTDWFVYFERGLAYYLNKSDLVRGNSDLEQAIALMPDANLPYVSAMMIALREGRITDAQALASTVLAEFPDPELTNRAFTTLYGSADVNPVSGAYFAAATNIILGRYEHIENDLSDVLAQAPLPADGGTVQEPFAVSDLLMMHGLALCNLDSPDKARQAYDQAIAITPDDPLLYVLRAEVAQRAGDSTAAEQDFEAARERSLDPTFDPWIEAAVAGQWTCTNLLDYALPEATTP